MKNKRNLKTKWLLLQNDQNADTTLLHSHDDMSLSYVYSVGQKSDTLVQWKKKRRKNRKQTQKQNKPKQKGNNNILIETIIE